MFLVLQFARILHLTNSEASILKKNHKWDEFAAIRSSLSELASSRKRIVSAGRVVAEACEGSMFPADLYFMAACNRALQNLHAFSAAMKADHYSTGMILLRIQMDCLLRCFAITQTEDPHETANKIAQGEKLRKLKDKDGKPLTDARIIELAMNSGASSKLNILYEMTSGYVHMSGAAYENLLSKARPMKSGENHTIYIGAAEPDVEAAQKIKYIKIFKIFTMQFTELSGSWAKARKQYGDVGALQKKYGPKPWAKN